ncbi:uncharacterized protein METZ01_LOCUS149325 [marine metagenome]|uniref:Uncharacterized protein n=1 Tax=marine metagenome TaxID=408172 RepID=A0A382A5F7_9ZZZZ
MIYDLDIKFLFYDGGQGGDALARAITCRLPFSNNYDTSHCSKSLNKHSCNDVFSGLFQQKTISKELAEKLNLSSEVIIELPINEKQILLEFCFKLWLVSWENSKYDDYNYKGTKQDYITYIKSYKLVVGQELNNVTRQLVNYLMSCKLPSNLPDVPYLAKGHYIKWEEELSTLFSRYENIYITTLDDDPKVNIIHKLWVVKVLWFIKTGKEAWEEMGYRSERHAFKKYDLDQRFIYPKTTAITPTHIFDSYKLIYSYNHWYVEKLLDIFNLTLNGVIQDFLRRNAEINRKMVKEFSYE